MPDNEVWEESKWFAYEFSSHNLELNVPEPQVPVKPGWLDKHFFNWPLRSP